MIGCPPSCRCITITSFALVVAFIAATVVTWFVVRPAPLEYAVVDPRVHGYNLTGGRLSATFDLGISATNRNHRVGVYYDAVEVTVQLGGLTLATAEVAPFFHRPRNTTVVRVVAVASAASALPEAAVRDLKRQRTRGKVAVAVRVRGRIRFRVAGIKWGRYTVRVYCAPVQVYFAGPNPNGRTECESDVDF